MQRVLSKDLRSHAGGLVRLAGWLHRQRRLSKVSFAVLRDASGLAQVVADDLHRHAFDGLVEESVIEVTGMAVANDQAPNGVEVVDPSVKVLSTPVERPPLNLYRPVLGDGLPTVLDLAPLALRHPLRRALFRVAASSQAGFRNALEAIAFTEINTPKIVASATEGGANVFSIDYFGRRAFLAQSPQFYKQAMVGVFERVFETGPAFRAEPHDTPRHLNEFLSLDAELGFIDDHHDVMTVLRDAISGMVHSVSERATAETALLRIELPNVPHPIPEIHFSTALEMLSQATGDDLSAEPDLAPAHERWLSQWAAEKHGSEFLFITGYPMIKRPFYTHPDPERPEFSNSFDLLFRGLELVTGGQRLHRYADYVDALAARGESPAAYEAYLQAFKYGMPPHGGFAIGLERWVARLAGLDNVRAATLFPRDRNRLSP
ncbi:MAG: aspartate--tRNA(Asn) ligase [Actinomycetota bacterium]|nr:aspartate--tRNA(Asn) ligase [Actinomycetota bacterium]